MVGRAGAVLLLAACVVTAGCVEDRRIQPAGSVDAGGPGVIDASIITTDGVVAPGQCDMTGVWIVGQVVFATSLGADQKSLNFFYHDITQDGDVFTINKSLNCGFRVTGTTTVTIPDATLEALAINTSSSVGRQGTSVPTGDGNGCKIDLDRTYNIRAATKSTFLTDHWVVGDPAKPLSEFPTLPPDSASGMEDWDSDSHEGFTLSTGLGERYVAQRDWNEHHGVVPLADFNAGKFGGESIMGAVWDAQEAVSDETPPLLAIGSTPINPGWAWYAKVGDALEIVEDGARPVLETCKNVQRLVLKTFPNP